MSAIIRPHSKGLLKDGREFEIVDFINLAIASDGSIHSGILGVAIDGKYDIYTVSMIAEELDYEDYKTR